jgi:hypothetical protein
VDFNDDLDSITWVWAIGNWKGSSFVVPELGIQVPVLPGQLFGVCSRRLAHFAVPPSRGRWVIFTCFTEGLLLKHDNYPIVTKLF